MPRLTGHLGSIYINTANSGTVPDASTLVAETYNWTMEMTVEALPCSVKGDKHETYAIGATTTRITCERYVTAGAYFGARARAAGLAGGDDTGTPATGAVVGFELHGVASDGTNFVVSGEGIVTRGNLSAAHNQLLNDTLEITCHTMPTVA